jgi:Fe2+ transport system protein FeoA
LKSLGICVGRRVQLAKVGDPLIVRVLGTRVGLSARLAECVVVDSL